MRKPATAVVGGTEFTIGGWGAYELRRRHERKKTGDDDGNISAYYPHLKNVHAEDVVKSALGTPTVLNKAAERLARVLGRLEDKVCDPDADGVWECSEATPSKGEETKGAPSMYLTIPALTSADVRDLITTDNVRDPESLQSMGESVVVMAAGFGKVLSPMPDTHVPLLPYRAAPVSNDSAVIRLESAVRPHIDSVEELQAALATRMDEAAAAIEHKYKRGLSAE
jgi:hypothetical protein